MPSSSWLLGATALLSTLVRVDGLYWYMSADSPKCFYEDLPKDTLVNGHYTTDVYAPETGHWAPNTELGIHITVDETFDSDHRVVSNRGKHQGRFTFTAADAGEHRICFAPLNAPHGGWLSSNGIPHDGIRFTLDMATGETSAIESSDKGKMGDILQKVKDLNNRMNDVRREQVFQRERESEFRDQSEATNARVVRWMLIQLVVLAVTCAWQLSHLRAFFIKQKLT